MRHLTARTPVRLARPATWRDRQSFLGLRTIRTRELLARSRVPPAFKLLFLPFDGDAFATRATPHCIVTRIQDPSWATESPLRRSGGPVEPPISRSLPGRPPHADPAF